MNGGGASLEDISSHSILVVNGLGRDAMVDVPISARAVPYAPSAARTRPLLALDGRRTSRASATAALNSSRTWLKAHVFD